MGLRELKKQKTKQAISDIATKLFLEHGYDQISVNHIAKAAEVSEKTVFNYFPKKEALVFDIEDELDHELIKAIRARKAKQSVLDALYEYFLTSQFINIPNPKERAIFMKLVRSTPELHSYLNGMFNRYSETLSREIRRESKMSKIEADCLAKLILESASFASSSSSPREALESAFNFLKKGCRL